MNNLILIKGLQDGYDQYEGVGPNLDEPVGIGDVIVWVFPILFIIFGIKAWLEHSYEKGYKDRDNEDKSDEEKNQISLVTDLMF